MTMNFPYCFSGEPICMYIVLEALRVTVGFDNLQFGCAAIWGLGALTTLLNPRGTKPKR